MINYLLLSTAASIGFLHTLLGPDHYLPFTVLSKSRNWSIKKTALITIICGLGHVLSSVILGFIGVYFGIILNRLEMIESFRGEVAAGLLTIFGFCYLVWGIWRIIKNKPHTHKHIHDNGEFHEHLHKHTDEHTHVHDTSKKNITPWALFIIFLFGPCEPLIPIIMYPAMSGSWLNVWLVAIIFSLVTIVTMLGIVLTLAYGLKFINISKLEKYSHALAGFVITISGLGILFLGW